MKRFFKWFIRLFSFLRPKKPAPVNRIEYPAYTGQPKDQQIFDAINQYRINKGVKTNTMLLQAPQDVIDIAGAHAAWLAENVDTPADVTVKAHWYFQTRVDQIQLRYGKDCRVGENIAYNYITAASHVAAWDNSPSHQQNMVSPVFTHLAVATNGKMTVTLYITLK